MFSEKTRVILHRVSAKFIYLASFDNLALKNTAP